MQAKAKATPAPALEPDKPALKTARPPAKPAKSDVSEPVAGPESGSAAKPARSGAVRPAKPAASAKKPVAKPAGKAAAPAEVKAKNPATPAVSGAKPAAKGGSGPSSGPKAKPAPKTGIKPPAKPGAKAAGKPSAPAVPKPRAAAAQEPKPAGASGAPKAKTAAAPAPRPPSTPPAKPTPAAGLRPGGETQGQATVFFARRPLPAVAPGAAVSGRDMLRGRPADKPAPPQPPTSRKELATVKAGLEERRERLLAGMKREMTNRRERDVDVSADEVDKATDAYDEDLRFEMASATDGELDAIAAALRKLEAGTYGQCEACGRPIGRSRLRVLPFAITCVGCRGREGRVRRSDEAGPLFSLLADDETEAEDGDA